MNERYTIKEPARLTISGGEQAAAITAKRVLAGQIQHAMKEQNINKSQMAKLMLTSRSSLDRLLDTEDASLTLATLAGAASVLGKKIDIQLV
jgi:antitoxin HicB